MYTAAERVRVVEDQRLYKKVGRKYIQANDSDCYSGLREGWWLVKVGEGCTSIRASIRPDYAEIEAAMKDAEDKIVDIIRKATEAKAKPRKITPEFKKAWERMVKKFGPEMSLLHYDSMQGIAETIVKEVLNNKRKKENDLYKT